MSPGQYLTVSIPRVPPDQIKGIRVARRAGVMIRPAFEKVIDGPESGQATWRLVWERVSATPPEGTDVAAYAAQHIVVVPMIADEHDEPALADLAKRVGELPGWP
jgi:broad specificity polyphosphatase/5'/3'-nucleotidase SurE